FNALIDERRYIEAEEVARIAEEIGADTVPTYDDAYELYGAGGASLGMIEGFRLWRLESRIAAVIRAGQDAAADRSLYDTVATGIGFDELSQRDQRLASFVLNGIEQSTAGSARQLSTYWVDDGEDFGGDEVVFPAGYRVITDHLATGLTVRLGHSVTRVAASSGGAEVTTQQGIFTGDRAVVTLPLGVLKAGAVEFSPGLPPSMKEAIDGLRMGVLNKTCLRFPSVFWPAGRDWLMQIPQEYGQWTTWLNASRALEKPILTAFHGGDFGREIESWSDREIVSAAMERLRSMFGSGIPDPVDFQITRWGSDPYTWGSYSYLPVGSHPDLRDALAANMEDRVFFAGEAASRRYYATVHAAYLSGIAAADKVMAAGRTVADSLEPGTTSAR
ncbi:MAG: FAD-dependent oxidoreductase, partial [Holophagales bacterium]|nr:FAD-dependent oxidoreductase [Holophagales bacterium]